MRLHRSDSKDSLAHDDSLAALFRRVMEERARRAHAQNDDTADRDARTSSHPVSSATRRI